ncbi:MAG: SUMF1/EgtB/PvdO family nonheme iron enzyme [Ignavibacteriae bacterium]|nr:SUMF1/EgtB/PvdO family nonheme iron enzyme [Ignavibacteriota bacterium]
MKIKVISFITALLLAVLLLLTSCGDNGNPIDNNSPNIEILKTNSAFVGQAIIIKGKNFGTTRENGYVSLGGAKLNDSSHYSWSDSRIVIIIPVAATTGGITVNAAGKSSNSVSLTIKENPEPSDAFIDYLPQDIAQPRQSITINGKNFGNIRGAVEFNGLKAEDSYITFWGSSKVTVKVPDEATTGKIVVFTYDSTGTNTAEFKVQNPNPLVNMIKINAGDFTMGSDDEDEWYRPAHAVRITKAYYIGKYEVTQKQYEKVMNFSNPSRIKGDSMPVDRVGWMDAIEFCNELSKMENYDNCYTINGSDVTCNFEANGYRLPTEAEWEYACRAGTTGKYPGQVFEIAWTNSDQKSNPQIVGTKQPNAWGIYDMNGNVWEWCWDFYSVDFYGSGPYPHVDPSGPATSDVTDRVIRGGSYLDGPEFATSAARGGTFQSNFNLGFRVVRKAK